MPRVFPNNVRHYRKKKKLTIQQLHELSGVSCGHISDIESGKCVPGLHTSRKLAKALDVSLEELFPAMDDANSAEAV